MNARPLKWSSNFEAAGLGRGDSASTLRPVVAGMHRISTRCIRPAARFIPGRNRNPVCFAQREAATRIEGPLKKWLSHPKVAKHGMKRTEAKCFPQSHTGMSPLRSGSIHVTLRARRTMRSGPGALLPWSPWARGRSFLRDAARDRDSYATPDHAGHRSVRSATRLRRYHPAEADEFSGLGPGAARLSRQSTRLGC